MGQSKRSKPSGRRKASTSIKSTKPPPSGKKLIEKEVELEKADEEATGEQIIALRASGKTEAAIGKIVEWDQKKVHKFLMKAESLKQLTTAKKLLLEAVNSNLVRIGTQASDKLSELMHNTDPSICLNAAKVTLDAIGKLAMREGTVDRVASGVALQVNIGGQEAQTIVTDELRKHHNR